MKTPHDHSTLEVDMERQYLETQGQSLPEVNQIANSDLELPEAVPETGGYSPGYYAPAKGDAVQAPEAASARRICGLRRRVFYAAVVVLAVMVIGVAVGVAVGLTTTGDGKSGKDGDEQDSSGGTNSSSGTGSLLSSTRLAAANFTDEFGNENFLVFYQLESRALYMSAYNSSRDKWVVSPVVDGTNGIGLDQVRNGTAMGLDVFNHNATWRDIHFYWQSPSNTIKTLFRNNISTSSSSSPGDWTSPFSYDRYSAATGSSIVSYGRQCSDCINQSFMFFESEDDGLEAGSLPGDNEDGWTDLPFQKALTPSKNSSIALTSVPATNGTKSLTLFYRTESGVLTELIYGGEDKYWQDTLPRGLGERSSIAAFATGWNETDADNSDPLGFQVLTADPDSDKGVFLTYYAGGDWVAGDEVEALSNCSSRATVAATMGHRVYCLVDGDDGGVEIVEWAWKGDPQGDPDTFKSYDKVGTVDTSVE